MVASTQPVWGLTQGCRLLWREYDGEHLAYNTDSGDTHLLDPVSAQILRKLESADATEQELQNALVRQSGEDAAADARHFIALLLEKLHALGVIEPKTS